MKKKVEGRNLINCIYFIIIILIALSNVFSNKIELFLRLKPDIKLTTATQVHFIDVGQGDAIALNLSNGKTMLIDSGTKQYCKKLCYYLDNIVVKDNIIDYLVLTHPDKDHSGNIEYILRNYKVKKFFRPRIYEYSENRAPYLKDNVYKNILHTAKELKIETIFNDEQTIVDDNLSIRWLDVLDMQTNLSELDNNSFCPMIIVNDNSKSLMLTGDMDSDCEAKFIDKYDASILDIDILKLGHHGSKFSTSTEFLEITSPDYAISSTGINTYGHPANEVIERILDYDEKHNKNLYDNFYVTRDDGNVIVDMENQISVETISNIDSYNFVDYWIYSLIFIFILLIMMSIPYIKVLKKNIRFIIQNNKYKKMKDKETK